MHISASPRPGSGAAIVATARPFRGVFVVRGNEPSESSDPGAFSMFGTLTGMAVLIAVLVGGSMALGYLLDEALSAPHVFLFAGLVLGVGAAALATRSIVKRYFGS